MRAPALCIFSANCVTMAMMEADMRSLIKKYILTNSTSDKHNVVHDGKNDSINPTSNEGSMIKPLQKDFDTDNAKNK